MSSPLNDNADSSGSPHPESWKQERDSEEITPANTSEYEDAVRAAAPQLRGHKLTAALAFVAGTGFTLFGCVTDLHMRITGSSFHLAEFRYDQGVMSALLTAKQVSTDAARLATGSLTYLLQFERVFPEVVVNSDHPNHATLQSFVVAIYVWASFTHRFKLRFVDRYYCRKLDALSVLYQIYGLEIAWAAGKL